ncbi:MAG: TRAP transporter large permease subunit [Deltaproteobacteria bacterium]|nr:TRAP transporter large permease subunit [Deltaproteobacteria bacterium]MBW1922678.1 TRAP transporter large permease subunit [Deltaproteobacteria bacterium]MBW2007649.1 TRAP transporter large permease subunit [Deltaproteobacteria bacterium]
MEVWLVALIIFLGLFLALFLGLPVSFSCGGLAAVSCLFIWGPRGLYSIATTAYGEMTIFVFLAVPLFIMMAEVLSFSGIAEDLFDLVYKWMGPFNGGLAIGTVIICAVFAAMVGVSTAAAATMGLVALPPMLNRGYSKELVTGTIAAGGALGILIPPSVIMIILGHSAELSIGQLFLGGMVPGLVLTLIFVIYIGVRSFINPSLAPALPPEERVRWREKLRMLQTLLAPFLLVVGVLGSIYTGICTPTEAAAVGALGAILCAAFTGRLTWANFNHAVKRTGLLTAMILWITIGAVSFTNIVTVSGVSGWLHDLIAGLDVNRWVILAGMQFFFFVLGCCLDPVGIILITTPIFLPMVVSMGFDPLWFGVLFIINMEMAYVTPPFGFNLFVLRGVVPEDVSMMDIYKGIVPFVACQAFCLILMMVFPGLVTWLPQLLIQ